MPNIPIDFGVGATADSTSAINNQPDNNLFQAIDRATGKSIVTSPVIPEFNTQILTGGYLAGVIEASSIAGSAFVTTVVYSLVTQSNSDVFEISIYKDGALADSISVSPNFAPPLTASYSMASNGVNIVCVDRFSSVSGLDLVFDIATSTLSLLTADPNYSGFGAARDVTFLNERYYFITEKNIFHGDTRTDAGKGVAFNALSFAPIPTGTHRGAAIVSANGRVYVLTENRTFLYQDVGTTPFSLQRNTSVELEVGCSGPAARVVANSVIYVFNQDRNGRANIYSIAGTDFRPIGDEKLLLEAYPEAPDVLGTATSLTEFSNGESSYIQLFPESVPEDSNITFYLLDLKTGRSHLRKNTLSGNYPAYYYASSDVTPAGTGRTVYSYGYRGGLPCYVPIYPTFQEDCFLDDYESGGFDFVYHFTFIRNNSEPFSLQAIRLSLMNCDAAELEISENGTDYTSLGELDLSTKNNGAKIAEWRRINRQLSQAMFRVTLTQSADSKRPAIVDGVVRV